LSSQENEEKTVKEKYLEVLMENDSLQQELDGCVNRLALLDSGVNSFIEAGKHGDTTFVKTKTEYKISFWDGALISAITFFGTIFGLMLFK